MKANFNNENLCFKMVRQKTNKRNFSKEKNGLQKNNYVVENGNNENQNTT